MTTLGSYYDVPAGLGGVRVLAGLGCGGGCSCAKNSADGLGTVLDFVKSPIGIGIALGAMVGVFILIRESVR